MKAGFLAAGLLLALAPAASAAIIAVNTNGDQTPANDGACTLREAIVAANTDTASGGPAPDPGECAAGSGTDTIDFAGFTGNVAANTITLTGGSLPDLTTNMTIDGGNCGSATAPRPCVGVNGGSPGVTGFHAAGGAVTIRGLAITNAGAAVLIDAAGPSAVKGDWFGVKLDATSAAGNAVVNGVAIQGEAADGNTIGGTTPVDRNVFTRTTGPAVAMDFGPDNNSVTGNYFGTLPNGSIVATGSIETGISIAGDVLTGAASGNTIGGAETLSTPTVCDGACNLLDNAFNNGINLDQPGGTTTPAQSTTIADNFIGLGLDGATDAGNGFRGVNVGGSLNTSVGGPPNMGTLGNYIDGNDSGGVEIQGGGASNAKVQSNFIGVPATGATPVPNSSTDPNVLAGVHVGHFTTGATIVRNQFRMNGVTFEGSDGFLRANTFLGSDNDTSSALVISGDRNQIGLNPSMPMAPQRNVFGNLADAGQAAVALDHGADDNTVLGNWIGIDPDTNGPLPIAGTGIRIGLGAGSSPSTGNVVGANSTDMSVSENVISNVGRDAISLSNNDSDDNHILRNTGRDNGSTAADLFVDLLPPDGFGNNLASGPNSGIQVPVLGTPTATTVSGTGEAGDTVYVFSTFSARGDVRGFLTTAIVQGGGNWTATYPDQGNGVCITALQDKTASPGGSSELATPAPIGAAACDTTPPETAITSGPADGETIKTDAATFGLGATDANSPIAFQCKLDGAPFTGCLDPKTLFQLGEGTHTFQVRAIDPAGNVDPTPATRTFTVDTSMPPPPPTDITPPDTKIGKVKVSGSSATVSFSGSDPVARLATASAAGLSFKCKLDRGKFQPCTSPKRYKHLRPGKHKVQVEAIDTAGNVDASPAKRRFRVE